VTDVDGYPLTIIVKITKCTDLSDASQKSCWALYSRQFMG
jgi:hypothetical protein